MEDKVKKFSEYVVKGDLVNAFNNNNNNVDFDVDDKETAGEILFEYELIHGNTDLNINDIMDFYSENEDEFSIIHNKENIKKYIIELLNKKGA
jgi:hypothetical protein